jgi:hypothetical protein
MSDLPHCDRCATCAEKGETMLEMSEQLKLVDDNDRSTQILDTIIHLRHRYDAIPEAERNYATWDDLITSVGIHYDAEVAGEDCDEECERHAPLFAEGAENLVWGCNVCLAPKITVDGVCPDCGGQAVPQ